MKDKFILCPICGQHKFPPEESGYLTCPHCGWIHDLADEDESNTIHGPNDLPIRTYKLRYQYYMEHNPRYHWARDGYPEVQQIEPMDCPVCGKFRFEQLTWDDLYCGETPSDVWCRDCGWHYDLAQTESPDLQDGANAMSLNEYKVWYAEKIKENPDYSFFEEETDNYTPTPHKCPICGKYEFSDNCCFDICPFCGWEDDGTDDDSEILGANDIRFSLYKERYKKYLVQNPDYRWDKNGKP